MLPLTKTILIVHGFATEGSVLHDRNHNHKSPHSFAHQPLADWSGAVVDSLAKNSRYGPGCDKTVPTNTARTVHLACIGASAGARLYDLDWRYAYDLRDVLCARHQCKRQL